MYVRGPGRVAAVDVGRKRAPPFYRLMCWHDAALSYRSLHSNATTLLDTKVLQGRSDRVSVHFCPIWPARHGSASVMSYRWPTRLAVIV